VSPVGLPDSAPASRALSQYVMGAHPFDACIDGKGLKGPEQRIVILPTRPRLFLRSGRVFHPRCYESRHCSRTVQGNRV
jgi:hypothetical protein